MNSALGQLADFKGGSAFPRDEQGATSGAYPFMKVSDLGRGAGAWTVADAANWISDEQRDRLKPTVAPENATVFAKIGEGLRAERLRLLTRPTAIDNNMMAAIPREGVVPRYLYYLLKTAHLGQHAVGSALPYLKQSTLAALQIGAHDHDEQRAIAEVLGALDDKIAANRNVIRLSDELAELTFCAAARNGETVPLSSLARFVNGKAFTKGATGTGRVVIRIAELNSGLGGSTVRNDIEVADDHVARPGDLLFAWSGSLTVARWFREEAIVNQHIFKVIPDGHPLWLVNQAVRSKLRDYQGIAADKATTMGHIQRRHLDEPVTLPHQETTASLDARMSALWDRALAAEKENEKLATTRDGLLPLLMSGKLRVQDAEKQVGEVV